MTTPLLSILRRATDNDDHAGSLWGVLSFSGQWHTAEEHADMAGSEHLTDPAGAFFALRLLASLGLCDVRRGEDKRPQFRRSIIGEGLYLHDRAERAPSAERLDRLVAWRRKHGDEHTLPPLPDLYLQEWADRYHDNA